LGRCSRNAARRRGVTDEMMLCSFYKRTQHSDSPNRVMNHELTLAQYQSPNSHLLSRHQKTSLSQHGRLRPCPTQTLYP
jgi:hypothetical protein